MVNLIVLRILGDQEKNSLYQENNPTKFVITRLKGRNINEHTEKKHFCIFFVEPLYQRVVSS